MEAAQNHQIPKMEKITEKVKQSGKLLYSMLLSIFHPLPLYMRSSYVESLQTCNYH
jgi:hypothetical protein